MGPSTGPYAYRLSPYTSLAPPAVAASMMPFIMGGRVCVHRPYGPLAQWNTTAAPSQTLRAAAGSVTSAAVTSTPFGASAFPLRLTSRTRWPDDTSRLATASPSGPVPKMTFSAFGCMAPLLPELVYAEHLNMTEVFMPVRIEVMTLGEAWIAIATAILTSGVVGSWEGLPITEVFRATLDIYSPRVDDSIIAQHGAPERLPGCTRTLPATPEWQNSVTPTATRRACTITPTRAAPISAGLFRDLPAI